MCEFRDQVECRKYCLERQSPRGSYHLVEPAGRTHLLGKAFRIVDLECIVRAKQNRTPGQSGYESSAMNSEMDWSSPIKIDRNAVNWLKIDRVRKKQIVEVGKVVLGLATSHSKSEVNWQVRHGDQPWYPHVLWPLRWTIAHSTWMVPLLRRKLKLESDNVTLRMQGK